MNTKYYHAVELPDKSEPRPDVGNEELRQTNVHSYSDRLFGTLLDGPSMPNSFCPIQSSRENSRQVPFSDS
jgi:hypothetical protein